MRCTKYGHHFADHIFSNHFSFTENISRILINIGIGSDSGLIQRDYESQLFSKIYVKTQRPPIFNQLDWYLPQCSSGASQKSFFFFIMLYPPVITDRIVRYLGRGIVFPSVCFFGQPRNNKVVTRLQPRSIKKDPLIYVSIRRRLSDRCFFVIC